MRCFHNVFTMLTHKSFRSDKWLFTITTRTPVAAHASQALSKPTIQTPNDTNTQTPHFTAGRIRNSPREGNAVKMKASVDVIQTNRPSSSSMDQMSLDMLPLPSCEM